MISVLVLIFGIFLGFIFKNKLVDISKSIKLPSKSTYTVKFHVYFTIHQSGKKVNDLIRTESIQITVVARNDEEVMDFVNDMINNEARIEIETLEKCN